MDYSTLHRVVLRNPETRIGVTLNHLIHDVKIRVELFLHQFAQCFLVRRADVFIVWCVKPCFL